MLWWGLDILLVVIGLAVLALLALRLWRQVRALGRQLSAAGERLGELSAAGDRLDELSRRRGSRT